jgi:hypothetical protein
VALGGGKRGGKRSGPDPAPGNRGWTGGINIDAAHAGEVDQQPTIGGAVAGDAVPAALTTGSSPLSWRARAHRAA